MLMVCFPSFHLALYWGFFHSFWLGFLSSSPHFWWLFSLFFKFLCLECSALPAVFMGWTSVVGILWDSVVWSLWSPCLDGLGLPFPPFVWALLLYFGFTCWWLLCWWVLPSIGLTGSQNSHLVLYAVVQVLVYKVVLPDSQSYASKKSPLPHQQSWPQLSKD